MPETEPAPAPVDETLAQRVAAALYQHEWPKAGPWADALAMDREAFLALAAAVLAELAPELADTETAVRGVQQWMALDLHRALGRGTNVSADCQHQGFPSWADWWADLIAQVRRGHTAAVARGVVPAGWYCTHCGRGDAKPGAGDWAQEFQRAEAAEAVLVLARAAHRQLRASLAGFQDVLDPTDRAPWANTVGAALNTLDAVLAEPDPAAEQPAQ